LKSGFHYQHTNRRYHITRQTSFLLPAVAGYQLVAPSYRVIKNDLHTNFAHLTERQPYQAIILSQVRR
jgi:hypothetical protein